MPILMALGMVTAEKFIVNVTDGWWFCVERCT